MKSLGSATASEPRKPGRPRLHPDGLQPVSTAIPRPAYDRLTKQATDRRVSLSSLIREKLTA